MEAQSEDSTANSINTSWSSAANWQISHGSLHTSVTVESSDSPVDSVTVDSISKSPLVVTPCSSDSGPCEIKISFKQKHEIQQVYVRSTARVYEIYYAPDLRSNNEYLCTVRCGLAERDEELLHTTDIEETVDTDSKGRSKVELAEEKSTNGSNNGSSEDDWVEVKIPNTPVLDNMNSSLPKKASASTSNIQDFYEATAEISDSDPCISITLRLLSLQNKERVFIGEIYVFADPVDLSDSENEGTVQAGNSSGTSLMAMLAPTLLQLSKSGISQLQENQPSTKEIGSKKPELNNTADRIPKDEKSDRQDVKLNADQQDEGERKYSFVAKNEDPYSRFEGILERLETRVSRIEDMFSRFEENMVKPINGIETRLERVEQHLEVLSRNFQNHPVLPSCTRFFAPAFSSMESYSSSYNERTDFPREPESEPEKDSPVNEISKPADETSMPVTAQFLTGLIVTAPEFSCGDEEEEEEEEENMNSKSSNDSPPGKPKKSISIDDALAAAFAGFSSMGSVWPPKSTEILEGNGDDELSKYPQPPIDTASVSNTGPSKYTQTLKVTAPEFTIEENSNDDKVSSPSMKKSNVSDCVENSLFEEMDEGVNGGDQAYEGCTDCSSIGTGIGSSSPRAKQSLTEDDQQIIEELVPKRDAFVVDFETPILDVAFVSRENSSSKSPLEALLGDAAGGVHDEESDSLVVLGNGGIDDNRLLVDLESYGVGKVEAEGGDDRVTGYNKQEVFESLI